MKASLLCMALLSFVVTDFCSAGLNIDPSQPVISAAGLHVVLPCRLDPPIDVQGFAVEWSELKPGASPQHPQSWATVYLYRDGKEEAQETIRSYVGRTKMFPDQLEHGNMSLRILNVTSADAGRYRCKCFIQGEEEDADVQLVVDPDLKTWTTETPLPPMNIQTDPEVTEVHQTRPHHWILPVVCCFLFVLVAIFIGFLMKRHHQNQTQNQKHDVA